MKKEVFYDGQHPYLEDLQYAQCSKEESMIERHADTYSMGVIEGLTIAVNGSSNFAIDVLYGKGYDGVGERIVISQGVNKQWNPSGPTNTPSESTGSVGIMLSDYTAGTYNYVWLKYAQNFDKAYYSVHPKTGVTCYTRDTGGYEIIVDTCAPDAGSFGLRGSCINLGCVKANGPNVDLTGCINIASRKRFGISAWDTNICAGVFTATTDVIAGSAVCAPTVCGTSILRGPTIYGTTLVCSPIVCATTCVSTPYSLSTIVCAPTKVESGSFYLSSPLTRYYSVSPSDFKPRVTGSCYTIYNEYVQSDDLGGTFFVSGVHLPDGACVVCFKLIGYTDHASAIVSATLNYSFQGTAYSIASTSITGAGGLHTDADAPATPTIVDNCNNSYGITISVDPGATAADAQFYGACILYTINTVPY